MKKGVEGYMWHYPISIKFINMQSNPMCYLKLKVYVINLYRGMINISIRIRKRSGYWGAEEDTGSFKCTFLPIKPNDAYMSVGKLF